MFPVEISKEILLTLRFPELKGQFVGNGGEHREDDDGREDRGGDVGQVGAQHHTRQDDDQSSHHTTKRGSNLHIKELIFITKSMGSRTL